MVTNIEANKSFVTHKDRFAFTCADLPAVLYVSIDSGLTWSKVQDLTSDDGTFYVVNNAPEGIAYKVNKDIQLFSGR